MSLAGVSSPLDGRAEEPDRNSAVKCCDPQDLIPFFQHICIQAHLILSYLNRE